MCYSGSCPYENRSGECRGRPKGALLIKTPCADDDEYDGDFDPEDADFAAILDFDESRIAH